MGISLRMNSWTQKRRCSKSMEDYDSKDSLEVECGEEWRRESVWIDFCVDGLVGDRPSVWAVSGGAVGRGLGRTLLYPSLATTRPLTAAPSEELGPATRGPWENGK